MKTVHYYRVYTNNYGSTGECVQLIELFRLNSVTIRVKATNGKISHVPSARFYMSKSTGNLQYFPQRNHIGYILEEYTPEIHQEQCRCALCKHFSKSTCRFDAGTGFCNYQNFAK